MSSPLNLAGRPWPARSSSARGAHPATRAPHAAPRTPDNRPPSAVQMGKCSRGNSSCSLITRRTDTFNHWTPACAVATGKRYAKRAVMMRSTQLSKAVRKCTTSESRWWADAEAAWSAELSHGWFSAARLAVRPYTMYGRTAPAHRPTAGSSALRPVISAQRQALSPNISAQPSALSQIHRHSVQHCALKLRTTLGTELK